MAKQFLGIGRILFHHHFHPTSFPIHAGVSRSFSLGQKFNRYNTIMSDQEGPVEAAIRTKLTAALKPEHLEVINESYMHNVPKGTESHFKVVIVSSAFENVKRIQKHRMVQGAIDEEMKELIHALSIVAKTPAEWEKNSDVGKSPPCQGGAGL